MTAFQKTANVLKGHTCKVKEFGCNDATPQASASVHAAVVATGSTQTSPFGFATAAQADNAITLLNQVRALLVANGQAV